MSVIDSVEQSPVDAGRVVQLAPASQSRNPWADAWRRLRRNRMAMLGLVVIILNILAAVFASNIAPYTPDEQNYLALNSAPKWIIDVFPKMQATGDEGGYVRVNEDYILGTDNLGRDLLTRIIFGARVSLLVAFIGPLVSLLVGTTYGMVAGYAGGQVDNLMMRFVDIMYAFPTLLLVILLMVLFRNTFSDVEEGTVAYQLGQLDAATGGLLFIFIGVGLTSWMDTARLARGQVLSIRRKEYIEASVAIGASDRAIIFRHVLPNILGPIIVAESLAIPRYISFEAFLSFIGLGVNPPTPSWGSLISDGANAIVSYPNQALFPAFALFLMMFAFNFLGDGLRDALDPRSSKRV